MKEKQFLLRKERGQENLSEFGTFVQTFDNNDIGTTEEIADAKLFSHIGDAMKESVIIYDKLGIRFKVESVYIENFV